MVSFAQLLHFGTRWESERPLLMRIRDVAREPKREAFKTTALNHQAEPSASPTRN